MSRPLSEEVEDRIHRLLAGTPNEFLSITRSDLAYLLARIAAFRNDCAKYRASWEHTDYRNLELERELSEKGKQHGQSSFEELLTALIVAVERETEKADDPDLTLVTLAAQKAVVAHVHQIADSERYYLKLFAESDPAVYWLNGAAWMRGSCRYCQQFKHAETCTWLVAVKTLEALK